MNDPTPNATENHPTCPHCDTAILGIVTCGPSHHMLSPCGCRVSTATARELAEKHDSSPSPRLATDGGDNEAGDRRDDVLDAVERHADPDHSGGAPVGAVVEDVLRESSADVGGVCSALRELYFTGKVYQPTPMAICQVSPDGGVE